MKSFEPKGNRVRTGRTNCRPNIVEVIQIAFQSSSGAGSAAEQPHLVLATTALVTGEGSAPGGAAPFGVTRAWVS
jgi:hypothetical protein